VTARPLEGRTVIATRSGPRAAGLVRALADAGATVLELPLTEQVDPSDGGAAMRAAVPDLGAYGWVVLTSVTAVERIVAALGDEGGALGSVRVAAVGPATADAVRAAGVEPELVPSVHSAAGLVDAFPAAGGERRRVLFPAADLAPPTVAEGLGAKGWDVERVEAYRTVPLPPPEPESAAALAACDAVVFLAASSVRAFAAASLTAPPVVACIGPATAAAARAAGLSGVQQASTATPEGIVAALADRLGSPPVDGS
jgi:uroporphyrinogen-III synthase